MRAERASAREVGFGAVGVFVCGLCKDAPGDTLAVLLKVRLSTRING